MIQNAVDRQGLLKIVLEAQVRRFERQYKGDRSSPAYSQGLQALVAAIKGANDMQLQKMATGRHFENGRQKALNAITEQVGGTRIQNIKYMTQAQYDRAVKEGRMEPQTDFWGRRKNLVEVRFVGSGKRETIEITDK